ILRHCFSFTGRAVHPFDRHRLLTLSLVLYSLSVVAWKDTMADYPSSINKSETSPRVTVGSLSCHPPRYPLLPESTNWRHHRLRERDQQRDAHSSYLFLSERGPMTRQAALSRPPAPAPPCHRLLSGQSRLRHPAHPGLSRAQKYYAPRALYAHSRH